MPLPARHYLDNAATSFPKPEAVYAAMDRYSRELGAAAGRGAYARAVEATRVVHTCRRRAAELLGAPSPERVIFTFNGTDSLNLAIHGALRPGDHVVTSAGEHNSVLRPLRHLERRIGVEVTVVGVDREGRVSPDDVRAALRPHTRLVAVTHASNVLGTIQPIEAIGEIARSAGALMLVDAAQTAGHLSIDLGRLPVDFFACSGHKGLLGPLGTGLLILAAGVEERVESLRQGGTGSQSEEDVQPAALPDKYEPGNHNGPGLAGLGAAIDWLIERGIDAVRRHEQELVDRLRNGLSRVPGVTLYGPADPAARTGVVSLRIDGFTPHEAANLLDEHFGVEARSGLHCAPGAHRALGTLSAGGTLRFSVGSLTATADVDAAVAGVRALAQSA